MKRLLAFVFAVLIFLVCTGGFSLAVGHVDLKDPTGNFKTWYNPYKDRSARALTDNLGPATMPVFGSSEFGHQKRSPYYIGNLFSPESADLMIIGQAFSQDLNHATTLAAMAPSMKKRKVVLLISPTWFIHGEDDPRGFLLRFSDSAYLGMLKNPNLSKDLKRDISKRTRQLLRNDPEPLTRVRAYDAVWLDKTRNPLTRILARYFQLHTRNQELAALVLAEKGRAVKTAAAEDPLPGPAAAGRRYDWKTLYERAGRVSAGRFSNPVRMSDRDWEKKYHVKYKRSKNIHSAADAAHSAEYGDLALFLRVCREEKISAEIIIQPINGRWYDRTGLTAPVREEYRKRIRAIAEKYGARSVDLSNYDYTPGVLSDTVHPWAKGWVILNENIYRYYKNPDSAPRP